MKKILRESRDVVVGIDQSASGTAAVSLMNGRFDRMMFFADTKKSARELSHGADEGNYKVVPSVEVKGGDEVARVLRLRSIREEVTRFILLTNPTHVAFEGYSMTKAPLASRVLGEVGGTIRLVLCDLHLPFRVYPVGAIKSFATGKANAEKADMVLACRDRWDELNFLKFGKTDGAAGNLADAYVIAQLLHLELCVRRKRVALEDLDPNDRAVLLRTTPKEQPIPIVETPFAQVPAVIP